MNSQRKYAWCVAPLSAMKPLLGIVGFELTGWTVFCWLPLLSFHILFPAIDHLIGVDPYTPKDRPEGPDDPFFAGLIRANFGIQITVFVVMVSYIASQDLSWAAFLGFAISSGIAAAQGINAAHELGHKNNLLDRVLAKVMLALAGYGHFFVEHNVGHHRDVATPEDSASARFGETLYQFTPREWVGGVRRAWQLETARLEKGGGKASLMHHQVLQVTVMTLVLFGGLTLAGGGMMLLFLLIQALYGWFLLSVANYIEHYGLLRQTTETGRYERCQPKHSWNANFLFSNLLLFNLQRHSDHHAYPARAYQELRTYDDVPTFPSGYPLMFTLAMIPPLWRYVMHDRVLATVGGDVSKLNCAASYAARPSFAAS